MEGRWWGRLFSPKKNKVKRQLRLVVVLVSMTTFWWIMSEILMKQYVGPWWGMSCVICWGFHKEFKIWKTYFTAKKVRLYVFLATFSIRIVLFSFYPIRTWSTLTWSKSTRFHSQIHFWFDLSPPTFRFSTFFRCCYFLGSPSIFSIYRFFF